MAENLRIGIPNLSIEFLGYDGNTLFSVDVIQCVMAIDRLGKGTEWDLEKLLPQLTTWVETETGVQISTFQAYQVYNHARHVWEEAKKNFNPGSTWQVGFAQTPST